MSSMNALKGRFLHITYIAGFLFIKVLFGIEALGGVVASAVLVLLMMVGWGLVSII